MAEKLEIVGSVKIDTSGAEAPVKSLKAQLKEANNELVATIDKFGEISPQAQKAAARVAQLKDKIGDAKVLSDAFNPDAKFKALGNAIQGAAGAFSAITAAQALFGNESKAVQETLLKVQSAMALTQGINSVLESGAAFKALGAQLMSLSVVQKVVTAGQWLWNAAMAANPIGAIVAVVAALIAGIVALTSWLIKSSDAAKQQAAQVKENGKEVERLGKQLEKTNTQFEKNQAQQLAMAKASGKSAEEIRKLELKLADEKIAFEQSARAIASNTRTKELNYLATLKQNGASDETIKAQQKVVENATKIVNDQNDKLQKAYDAKTDIENRHQVERTQAATDGEKKRSDDAKKAAEERAAADKAANENILKMTQEFEASKITNANDAAKKRLENELQNSIKAVEQSKASEELKQQQIALLKQKYNADVQKIDDEENKKRLEAQKKYDQDRLKVADDLAKQAVQIELNAIKNANERRDKELQINRDNEIKAAQLKYAQGLLTLTEYLQQQALIRARFQQQENSNAESDAKTKFGNQVKELDSQIANNNLAFQIRKDAVDKEKQLIDEAKKNNILSDDEYKKAVEKNSADRKAIRKAELEYQLGYAKQFGSILSGLGEVLGKNTKAGKKAAIAGLLIDQGLNVAKITMDTITSTKAIAKKYSGVPGGQIPAAIEIALNIAQGALSVTKAVQAAKKGIADINAAGGGGGEGGTAGGGGGDMATGGAPIAPQAQQTALPQEQINQLASANAATRAYVLESDVSGNQERITRINRAARIS